MIVAPPGHSDARLAMFGSSVNGIGFRSGVAFDGVKRSDFDLAVVSRGAVASST